MRTESMVRIMLDFDGTYAVAKKEQNKITIYDMLTNEVIGTINTNGKRIDCNQMLFPVLRKEA